MAVVPMKKPRTLGAIIDGMWDDREQKRALEKQVKEIEARLADSETELLEALAAQGIDKSSGKKASVSVSEATMFSLDDDEAFFKYVKRTGYFHLLQRRLSDVACREVLSSKGVVPGLTPFTKRKINLRSL